MPKKPSLFQRLTGSVNVDDESEFEEDADTAAAPSGKADILDEPGDAQLTVDVHQTPDAIIVKTMAAGVRPDDLDISISRDMITIRGERQNEHDIEHEDYYQRELYWGSFSRTILLPCEVEPEEAVAVEKHGLLIITLPKIDKNRQMKLKVNSSK